MQQQPLYVPGGPASTMMAMVTGSSSSVAGLGGSVNALLAIVRRVLMLVCPNSWQWLLLIATSVAWGMKKMFGSKPGQGAAGAAVVNAMLRPMGAAGVMNGSVPVQRAQSAQQMQRAQSAVRLTEY
jgi:hypothetical protein